MAFNLLHTLDSKREVPNGKAASDLIDLFAPEWQRNSVFSASRGVRIRRHFLA